jgi:hypothetical protein
VVAGLDNNDTVHFQAFCNINENLIQSLTIFF